MPKKISHKVRDRLLGPPPAAEGSFWKQIEAHAEWRDKRNELSPSDLRALEREEIRNLFIWLDEPRPYARMPILVNGMSKEEIQAFKDL